MDNGSDVDDVVYLIFKKTRMLDLVDLVCLRVMYSTADGYYSICTTNSTMVSM